MAVLPVRHWLPMIRIYLLYRVVKLSFIIKTFYALVALAMTTIIANALTEDISQNTCENQGYNNAYFLIDKNDFYSAAVFYYKIGVIDSITESNFESLIGQSDRTRIYYDFDDLDILSVNNELVSILNSDFRDYFTEREQINYIDTQTTPANINNFEVKYYNKKISPLDKHPLFSRIKRKERSILTDQLANISSHPPESISESLQIKSFDNIHFILLYGVPYASITLSRFSISNYNVPNTSLLIKFEKFHDIEDKLTKNETKSLDAFFCQIEENFQIEFPHIKSLQRFGYAEYYQLAIDNLPSRVFFRKYPEVFTIGQIIILSFIGLLFISLISGRYLKRDGYSRVSKLNIK